MYLAFHNFECLYSPILAVFSPKLNLFYIFFNINHQANLAKLKTYYLQVLKSKERIFRVKKDRISERVGQPSGEGAQGRDLDLRFFKGKKREKERQDWTGGVVETREIQQRHPRGPRLETN